MMNFKDIPEGIKFWTPERNWVFSKIGYVGNVWVKKSDKMAWPANETIIDYDNATAFCPDDVVDLNLKARRDES